MFFEPKSWPFYVNTQCIQLAQKVSKGITLCIYKLVIILDIYTKINIAWTSPQRQLMKHVTNEANAACAAVSSLQCCLGPWRSTSTRSGAAGWRTPAGFSYCNGHRVLNKLVIPTSPNLVYMSTVYIIIQVHPSFGLVIL